MNIIRCSYNFSDFEDADFLAKEAAKLGVDNVQIKKFEEGFKLLFNASWPQELKLIEIAINSDNYFGYFRTGTRYSQEEIEFLIDHYACWYPSEKIALFLRRTPSAISNFLLYRGLIEKIDQDSFGVVAAQYWVDNQNDLYGELISNDEIDSSIPNVLSEPHKKLKSVSIFNLSNYEIDRLISFLVSFDQWQEAIYCSKRLGDSLRAFRIACQGSYLIEAYKLIKNIEGLNPLYLYQRELLKAHICSRYIHYFSNFLSSWVDKAKCREIDYSCDSPPFNLPGYRPPTLYFVDNIIEPLFIPLSDDLYALTKPNSVVHLTNLTKKGNRLAAALLADLHRRKMNTNSNHSLDAANFAKSVQSGYWPTEEEIKNLLFKHIIFDTEYAKKMEHLNENYFIEPLIEDMQNGYVFKGDELKEESALWKIFSLSREFPLY